MREDKKWICNPLKNKSCLKSICGILDGRDISNPHKCFLTKNKLVRLEPSDPDIVEFSNKKERVEKWLKDYYGREDEVNGN